MQNCRGTTTSRVVPIPLVEYLLIGGNVESGSRHKAHINNIKGECLSLDKAREQQPLLFINSWSSSIQSNHPTIDPSSSIFTQATYSIMVRATIFIHFDGN